MTDEGTKPGDESPEPRIGLFEGFGVEVEYMLVDRESLDVRPVADRLLEAVAGDLASEVELGPVAWSNELVLHVLEVKTNGPAPALAGVADAFHGSILEADRILEGFGCAVLPGGAHPWMDPFTETRIWPHEYTEVYRTFDRIFSCRGHGWANLQSTHLNLPFQGDREFAALHSAIRVMLPLLPALAASTPFLDGKAGGSVDLRLMAYRENARRVPEVTGNVVPEPVSSREEYERVILNGLYEALAPLDPEGILRHEWANARGAIARFQRGAIEIRILDSQECPAADLAVVAAVVEVVRALTLEALEAPGSLDALETGRLASLLDATITNGETAVLDDPRWLEPLGFGSSQKGLRAGEIWQGLLERIGMDTGDPLEEWAAPLRVILKEGPLARRLLAAAGPDPSRGALRAVYGELAACLRENRSFSPGIG